MRFVYALLVCAVAAAQEWPTVRLHAVVRGLENITDIAAPADGSGRLFVLEQRGRVRVVRNGTLVSTPVLNIVERVVCCGERGLLGIAFPPGFAQKQYFYVNYTDREGATVVARYRLIDREVANPQSEEQILRIPQPFANHNGGQLQFGPDGFLYVGMGDGGSANDPQDNGQRPGVLLGKMLRIDTESGTAPYAIPSTNPFLERAEFRREIWAIGLRNPWRFSFDRETNDLWIADVGQNRAEEVNFTPGSSRGGENYGWRIMEGLQCRVATEMCNRDGLVIPVLEYTRERGDVSVSGGYVYRGRRFPALRGIYFYGDFGSGRLWGVRRTGDRWENRELIDSPLEISTFGQDEAGEVYVGDYGGIVYILAAGPPAVSANGVVNAASFSTGVVPGSLATVFGSGITSFNGVVQASTFPLPTELGAVTVTLNGTRVPVVGTANVNGQEQINFQVPFELAGSARATLVVNANGASSAPVEVPIAPAQPEIFAVTRAGDSITVWATGLGAVTNPPATGQPGLSSPLARTVADAVVTVAGADAPVSFSGIAPGFAGLYQINAAFPANGNLDEVVVRISSAVSRPWRPAGR
jgi:uncharacterized protein (TIGR03437 family)